MDPLHAFFSLFSMSTIARFLVDRIKEVLPPTVLRYVTPPVWSLILSQLMAFAFHLDLFSALGWMSAWPYLPQILTGLAISAGADPLHNLYAKLREGRTSQ